jgi:hypothetical protein
MQFQVETIPATRTPLRRARVKILLALTRADHSALMRRAFGERVILPRRLLGFEINFSQLMKASVLEFPVGTDAFAGSVKNMIAASLSVIAEELRAAP